MDNKKRITTTYLPELLGSVSHAPHMLYGVDDEFRHIDIEAWKNVTEPYFIHPDHQEMINVLIPDRASAYRHAEHQAAMVALNKLMLGDKKDVVVYGAGAGPRGLCYEFPLYDIERDCHYPLVTQKEPEQPKCSPLLAKLMKRI